MGETRRPERCVVTSATVKVVLVNTEKVVTGEVVVLLVVNLTTESTSTSTIQGTSVKLVCDTSTSSKTHVIATPSTWTNSGRWFQKKAERKLLLTPPLPPLSMSPNEESSRFSEKDVSQLNQSSLKLDSFPGQPKTKSRLSAVSVLLSHKNIE